MNNKRVVVTGLGVLTPIGNNVESFFNNLISGVSGIDYITKFDTSNFPVKIGAEIRDFDPSQYFDKKEAKRMDEYCQYALVASIQAVKDSELDLDKINKERFGVIIGSGVGGIGTFEKQMEVFMTKGPTRVSPFFIPMMISNIASGQVSISLGAKGYNASVVTACAAGTHSIGDAFEIIKRGDADVMVAGGAEASVTPMALAGFSAMKALSERNDDPKTASRPFDKERDGFVMGEGAGIIILESLEHALARNAKIYAELVGYGATADAYHITAPSPEADGATRAIIEAIEEGNIQRSEVDYINAHGTSTEYNDKLETLAIKKAFGEFASNINISSTKSLTGHLLGAAGAIEAVVAVMTIVKGMIPGTANYQNPDPECDLNYTPNKAVKRDVKVALSNSLGFGGHNATIAFRKYS